LAAILFAPDAHDRAEGLESIYQFGGAVLFETQPDG
jgi:hypothetical protein